MKNNIEKLISDSIRELTGHSDLKAGDMSLCAAVADKLRSHISALEADNKRLHDRLYEKEVYYLGTSPDPEFPNGGYHCGLCGQGNEHDAMWIQHTQGCLLKSGVEGL